MNVAILGASDKKERYAYLAMQRLLEKGHVVYPINPRISEIEGHKVYNNLLDIPDPIHTICIYVSPNHLKEALEQIKTSKPVRVIFNPGTESDDLMSELRLYGIEVVRACTLLLLSSNQFL